MTFPAVGTDRIHQDVDMMTLRLYYKLFPGWKMAISTRLRRIEEPRPSVGAFSSECSFAQR